jgi:Xaa-Pro aminopeptidase
MRARVRRTRPPARVSPGRGCEAGLEAYARAFAGHGIGIETVEAPLLTAASADIELVAGMALCVEPGVAVPGLGGALIEHELIVVEGMPRLLCTTPPLT